jgi:hypothetical protein
MTSILKVDTIQDQSGNNIINESSDTITIGASGDTISIPAGATLSSTDPLVFPAGTVSLPAITTTGDTNTGIFFPAADTIAFTEGGAEAMRINSSGNVQIGSTNTGASGAIELSIGNTSSAGGITLWSTTSASHSIGFGDGYTDTDRYRGYLEYNHTGDSMRFATSSTERMRIDNSGAVVIGKTAQDTTTAGLELLPSGILVATRADVPLFINRLSTDGILVLLQQNNTTEGTISVSGTTVSYNGFTGTHWSRFQDNSTPTILKGTVLESLDEMCDWYNLEFDVTTTTQDEDGNDVTETHTKKIPHVLTDTQSNGDVITYNHEGTDYQATIVKENDVKHMMSKVSDTVDAKNVYGVFVAYDLDGEGYNDFYVASVGSFVVRIKANETIAKGDLLQSNGDGTAKVQTDDAVRSSSFAKVLSTTIIETYEDGSFIVPCSLMC